MALTMKQAKYKKARLEGMSKAAAALSAGYSHATAYHHINDVEKRVNLRHWLEAQGLTDKRLSEKVNEGLNATKIIGYLHSYRKDEDGKVEKIAPDEVVSNEFVEVPDWHARHKYLETLMKLMGKLDDRPVINNHFVFFNDIVRKSREMCPSSPRS